MQVNMQQVKELRDRTQAGLNDCRSALIEAEGDMDKAVEVILKKGLAKSAKRAGAVAAEGSVAARVAADRKSGVLVEVNIQTDFAARNEDFLRFSKDILDLAEKAPDGAELSTLKYPGSSQTVEEVRQALVGRLGENITVRRWARVTAPATGLVHSYVHMGGKIGVLLSIRVGKAEVLKAPVLEQFVDDTSMQIAAMAPQYLDQTQVPADASAKQAEIYEAQLVEEGKPEKARPRIIEGKLDKWKKEVCLLQQASVLQTDKSVEQLLAEVSKELGTEVVLERFVRFERGEGLEKKKQDFASEVMNMAEKN